MNQSQAIFWSKALSGIANEVLDRIMVARNAPSYCYEMEVALHDEFEIASICAEEALSLVGDLPDDGEINDVKLH